jgi:hypothetical protein
MPFTPNDAQTLIRIARRAPLAHMDEAEAVAGLLTQFAEWANEQFAPPPNKPVSIREPEPDPIPSRPPVDGTIPSAAALRAAGIPVPEGHPIP